MKYLELFKAICFCLNFDPEAKPKLAKILEGIDYKNPKILQDPEILKLALQEMIECHPTHGHPEIETLLKKLDQQDANGYGVLLLNQNDSHQEAKIGIII